MSKSPSNKKIITVIILLIAVALGLAALIFYKPIISQQIISSWFESKSETLSETSKDDAQIKLLAPANSGSNLLQERSR
jgi:hypothetical protein